MNPGEYPGLEADLARSRARADAHTQASAAVLPGALRDAFAGEPRRLRFQDAGRETWERTLLPVTAGLEAVLTRIESPLLPTFGLILKHRGRTKEEVKQIVAETIKPAPESIPETVFCFLRRPPELRALLDKGRVVFREAAMGEIGDVLNPIQLALAYQMVSEHYADAFVTAIAYEAAPPEGGMVFPPPPAEATKASAGG